MIVFYDISFQDDDRTQKNRVVECVFFCSCTFVSIVLGFTNDNGNQIDSESDKLLYVTKCENETGMTSGLRLNGTFVQQVFFFTSTRKTTAASLIGEIGQRNAPFASGWEFRRSQEFQLLFMFVYAEDDLCVCVCAFTYA